MGKKHQGTLPTSSGPQQHPRCSHRVCSQTYRTRHLLLSVMLQNCYSLIIKNQIVLTFEAPASGKQSTLSAWGITGHSGLKFEFSARIKRKTSYQLLYIYAYIHDLDWHWHIQDTFVSFNRSSRTITIRIKADIEPNLHCFLTTHFKQTFSLHLPFSSTKPLSPVTNRTRKVMATTDISRNMTIRVTSSPENRLFPI